MKQQSQGKARCSGCLSGKCVPRPLATRTTGSRADFTGGPVSPMSIRQPACEPKVRLSARRVPKFCLLPQRVQILRYVSRLLGRDFGLRHSGLVVDGLWVDDEADEVICRVGKISGDVNPAGHAAQLWSNLSGRGLHARSRMTATAAKLCKVATSQCWIAACDRDRCLLLLAAPPPPPAEVRAHCSDHDGDHHAYQDHPTAARGSRPGGMWNVVRRHGHGEPPGAKSARSRSAQWP